MIKKKVLLAACVTALASGSVNATPKIKMNGFLTAGAAVSDSSTSYLGSLDEDFSFGTDSIFGLQVTAQVTDELSVTGQLLTKEGIGNEQNWKFEADWAYVKYQFTDTLAGRAGKLRLPLFVASDYLEVGYAYPWIRPPVEVYNQTPLNSYTGADVLFNTDLGPFEVQVQPYIGNIRDEIVQGGASLDITGDNLLGINATFSNEIASLRLSYTQTDVSLAAFGINEADTTFISAGTTIDWNNFVSYAEYARREVDNPLFADSSGWYVTAGYRFGKFLPHITVAASNDLEPGGSKQDSVTLGMRYSLNEYSAIKMEYQRVDAEASGVAPQQTFGFFDGNPGDEVGIFSVAIDIVF